MINIYATYETTINLNGAVADMPIYTPITIFKGEDKTLNVILKPPTDISTWTNISFTVRKAKTDSTAKITKTVGSGITITDTTNGVVQVALADTDTENLTAGIHYWDIKRMDPGSEVVLAYGPINIEQGITL